MDYSENEKLAVLAQNGDREALDALVRQNGGLIKSIAVRFARAGVDADDLFQIGTIGFMRAVRSFDPARGTVLSTYAVPLIIGEIKRFLRDDGIIKVSREAKSNYAHLVKKRDAAVAETGREPTVGELARACGIDEEDAVYAIGACGGVASLDTAKNDDEPTLAEFIGSDGTDAIVERLALARAVSELPESQRKIVSLRFSHGLSQSRTAELLGLSQVKISREEKKIFALLRQKLA